MRVEDLTKFEGECPNIVVFGTYMDIRVPLTKKWKKIINERGDKPNTLPSLIIAETSIMPNTSGDSIRPQNNVGRQTNQKLLCRMKKRMILQNRSVMSFMLTSSIIVPALRIKSSGSIFKRIILCRGIYLDR